MLHKPTDRHFFVIGGNVMQSGGSINLAKGQVGLFDTKSITADGLEAVSSFAGKSKDREYQIKLGIADLSVTRSQDNKAWSTYPFKLSDVKRIRVSKPELNAQNVDELVIGYDGIDPETAIKFKVGDSKAIYIRLSGELIGMLGYPNNEVTIPYVLGEEACNPKDKCVDCDDCDEVPCKPIIEEAVKFLRSFELRGGYPMENVVEITPVTSCGEPLGETEYAFFSLSVCDTGDQMALSLVQAQYPGYKIQRIDRKGSTSTYQLIAPEGTVLSDYTVGIASIMKGCDECPEGWDEISGGFVYAMTVADNGVDLSTDISTELDALSGITSESVEKQGQDGAVGFYVFITDAPLTSTNITVLLLEFPTATFNYVGQKTAICENDTITEATWTEGKTCTVSEHTYQITLPDNKCGEERLEELQAAYPNLTVTVATRETENSSQAITLTGTAGTATVTIDGETYTATFATSLAVTATNFVTSHAAAILAEHGLVVTADSGVLTFTGATSTFSSPSIENATEDLAGTVGEVTVVIEKIKGGCKTTYSAQVITNMVCDECDPVFRDFYISEVPSKYFNQTWKKIGAEVSDADCLCGIRIKGKEVTSYPEEWTRDTFGFIEDAVRVEASGGYITEVREGIGLIVDESFKVSYLQYWEPRTHVGGNLFEWENRSRMFFNGKQRNDKYEHRIFLGEESHIEAGKQYTDFAIDIARTIYSGGDSQMYTVTNTYHILAETGKEQQVQAMVQLLSGATQLPIEIN